MIGIYVDDFVHLIMNFVHQCEWEGVLVRVFTVALILIASSRTLRSLALLLDVLLWMVKVHCDIVTFVTVSLIVMDHSTCIASEEELHVLGQLYAGDSGFMIVDKMNYLAS